MESGTDSVSNVLIPVTEHSDAFKRKILAPLRSAYLYEESKLSFRYKWASFVKNPALNQKYAAFRAKRKRAGYSEDDLEETYGFLLFDDVNKANALGRTGVLTGTSSCSSLGDPLKGVYISMFSDCLGPERWQDGQSGYIAIIKLTTGRVKRVSGNHVAAPGAPTAGFDCHVSQHLASVTTRTSFSLAFERTQCYIYELLDDGRDETAPSPSLTCPFAVVAFSYKKQRALAMKEPKPRGFISCEILRILPVLRLAEGEVKKADADPNRGPCEIVANRTRTCSVMLNPGPAPSPSLLPAVRDADDLLSSPEALRAAGSPQTGSKDQPIGGKTPPQWQNSTEELKTEATAAPRNLHALNKSHDPRVKSFGTPDAAAQLTVTFASEQSVTEKSPVGPAKSEMTSTGEMRAGATLATNHLQVLNKSDDPEVKTLQTRDVPAEPMGSLACERSTVRPPKSETGPGEADAEATLAANAKTLRAPGVPAELIVSFTSEQSVTGKRPISPAPTKKPPSAKRRRASHCPATAPLTKKQRRKLLRKHSNGGEEAKEASFETPGLQNRRKPWEDDRLSRQPERRKAASTRDRQRLRKWAVKGRQVRRLTAEALKAREARPGNRTRHRAIGAERQAPPREKSERWNLKPVKSECGRVLVPHGSRRSAHPAEETTNVDGFPSPTAAPEAAGAPPRQIGVAPEPATRGTVIDSRTASPHRGAVRDLRDPVRSEAVDERAGPGAPDGRAAKRAPTCVLSGRKATTRQLGFDEKPPNLTAETFLQKTADLASAPDAAAELGGDSTRPCVKPQGMPACFQQRGPKGIRSGEAQLEAQGQKAEILCRPPSIYPKWKRVKTLRKHLDISREHFKKTWWMHFQRPSGADDAVKERLRDDFLRKKTPTSNASTDALNLLADLALGANHQQVPSQSDRDVARPPQSDLRKNGHPQNVAGAGEVSLLLTPRGQPGPTRSESPPVEGAEWARLLCQEHAYSLPLRASLPPGLPGTPFQVSPLSGSTGLLQRPRAARGVETPRAADDLEEPAENEDRQPSDHGRTRTTALNRYRSFVCQDGSVQVTRQWKEKYDFGRDSRFSSDPKDRTIIRALHGPWDFSLQDTREDMQLIVHMWIGFFYSRSTARFIDLGSDRDTNPRSADGVHPEAAMAIKARAWFEADGFEEQSERSLSNTSDLSGTSSLDRDSDVLNSSPGASTGFEVLPSDPQVHSAKASDSANSPTELKEQQIFQGNRATILSAEIADQAHCASRTVAPSPKENETRIQGEMATVSGEPQNHGGGGGVGTDRAQPKSDAGKMDLKGGSETAEATEPTGLRKHESGSPLTEKELRKETGGRSLRTDRKESPACCDTSVSARERPEAEQIGRLQLTRICCHRSNGHFVKGSDEKAVRISPAEAGRDLSDQPLALVLDCEHSERGHAAAPRRECFENQRAPTHVALQAAAAHATSGYTRDSVTKAAFIGQGSVSENISLVNLEMAAFSPHEKGSPCAATGALPLSGEEKAAPLAPIHRRPGFVQHQTVKHLGSDSQLAEEGQKKVRESPGGVITPFSFFSGESTKATSGLEEVLRDHARNGSPESIRELSTSRRTVLKAGQSGHIVGATGGAGSSKAHEKPSAIVQSQQQKHLIRRETVKLATEVGFVEEGQDEEVEGIHLRGVSPTGPRSQIEKTVGNHSPMDLVLSATSSPDSPCRRSVFQVEGETSRPDAAGDTRGAGSVEDRDKNQQRSRGSHFETFNRLESDVESVKPKDMPCAANFPVGGFLRENAPPAGPRSAVERPVRNRTEAGCLLGAGSPKSVPERSPRRVCVLKAGQTSRPVVAEGRSDSGSSPIPSDDRLEAVACSGRQNDISSEGSDPSSVRQWLDTKSSRTNACSPIETTNTTLGQPSNPSAAKDKRAKPTRAASTPHRPQSGSDRSVVTMPIRRRADEDRWDAPTSGTKSRERKYRFYILVTSEDAFFAETKACLEAAGHTAVQPSQFFLGGESSSLLIIIRNEDISAHLSEVPHLLELKKSPEVRFAGIDEPHDVMNLTHQELFLSGGFVMFDGPSLEALSLDKVKRLMEVLQELNKTGKWKWLLHYRDSRRFKENARFTAEAEEKKDLLSWSQETGLCAVLPYHECDAKSRDHPDYLACLVHSQVQNIAARFPVFVTDTRSAEQFEKNGILTATVDSFLMRFST